MATVSSPDETLADLLDRLGVPARRVLLHPAPGTATEADLLRSGRRCELVDGVLVEKAMGFFESRLAVALLVLLERYLEEHPLGFLLEGTGMVRVEGEQVRLPDVSFFAWEHFPGKVLPAREQILARAPDLAVEILSPSNTPAEMERKRREYFGAGTRLYWEIDPKTETARVFADADIGEAVAADGRLPGRNVLPGLSLPLKTVFEKAGQRG